MQQWLDSLIRGWGHDPSAWPWTQFVYLAFMGLFAFAVINFAAITAGIFSWAERRVAARMQSRVGPNRVGPGGFLQWVADAVKLLTKEDLIPGEDRPDLGVQLPRTLRVPAERLLDDHANTR